MQPLLALLVTFGLMWVLLIRPQQRRMRQHQAVVSSLRAGDEIVTAGGIYGTVLSVDDETMIVEVAPGVELRVLRAAVSQRVTADDGNGDDDIDDDDIDEDAYEDTDDDVDGEIGDDTGDSIDDSIGGQLSPGEANGKAGLAEPTRKEEEK